MPKPHHLAHTLRSCRKRQGRTQQDVADHAYTTQAEVSRWESGDREPYLGGLVRWADSLGLNITLTPRAKGDQMKTPAATPGIDSEVAIALAKDLLGYLNQNGAYTLHYDYGYGDTGEADPALVGYKIEDWAKKFNT